MSSLVRSQASRWGAPITKFLGEELGFFSFGGGSSAVGVSIGSSSIKVVELKKVGKQFKLIHFGMIQLPEDALVNREIVNNIAVVESLRTLVNQLKLKTKNICTSMAGTGVIVKRMPVEVQSKKDLQDQVFWDAEQYLPFDVSEVVMDYQLLNMTKDNKADVMLVAVKRSVLEGYIGCIEEAGLKAKVVDIDFFALQNLFESNYPTNSSESVCIVDIGATSMKIVIVHEGIPVFTKDVGLGGRTLTAEIQKHLNLSYADAESLKVSGQGGSLPQEVLDLMNVTSENFAIEIKRALDYYEASATGAPVSYLLLAGGSSKIPGLGKVVEDNVGVPAQIINPFNAISYDPAIFTQDYIASISAIAAVPLGLALRMGGK